MGIADSFRSVLTRVLRRESRVCRAVADFSRFEAWCRAHPIEQECDDRFDLYRWLREHQLEGPIDYLEFGVWEGESILHCAQEKDVLALLQAEAVD